MIQATASLLWTFFIGIFTDEFGQQLRVLKLEAIKYKMRLNIVFVIGLKVLKEITSRTVNQCHQF
jgi:hypothetical protein